MQEKISAEGTISELRKSLEQTHASNAALRDALYRERANNGSREDRYWANTAAFVEALQQSAPRARRSSRRLRRCATRWPRGRHSPRPPQDLCR